mgnify:CR=1 FL=1
MGVTTAHIKNAYNAKAYDRFSLMLKPKGRKAEVQAYASAKGKSMNAYIVDLIDKDMAKAESKGE